MSECKIELTCESCDVFSLVRYLRAGGTGMTLPAPIFDLCCLNCVILFLFTNVFDVAVLPVVQLESI